MKVKKNILFGLMLILGTANAQIYPPAAGQLGSTAIHKDSSIFINWANACMVQRGFMDISNPSLGYASVGDSSMAIGKAGTNGVVSLGDRGWATCSFPLPIRNGLGYDFAVFENGFDDFFLELAIVEVSSNGADFFAFPSHSLTDTLVQKGSFDSLDAVKLNNLAGKYRGGYGTPFDLQELQGIPNLDVQAITQVRVRDVVGSVNKLYATRDAYNNKINDPWPSPFPSSGFDLDAIGVIHQNTQVSVIENANNKWPSIYPNPLHVNETLYLSFDFEIQQVQLHPPLGQSLPLELHQNRVVMPALESGIYLLELLTEAGRYYKKVVLQN
ncbi:MAG: T9SS type A sorting domain-containing protein [Bacteroidia bacterium]|nr:T9SS type A sorting domain-containing protein [Bacteroidia bacterium]